MTSGRMHLRAEQRPTADEADARCGSARCAAPAILSGSGMGRSLGKHIVSGKPHEALAWLCEGLGFFASLGLHAVLNDKASKIPFEKDHVSNLKWSVSVSL
nr:PREDICTED: NADH dehydrogenase [ubiquinone] 1 beta subcomplex subunit 8, mitochondrial-like isoform X3 [Musa acuminata subsp. malaccensis]